MFAYLIIGVELVTLYFVFWVVFIREPKPREVNAELWGHYEDVSNELQNNEIGSSFPSFAKQSKSTSFLPSSMKARLYKMAKLRRGRHKQYMKRRCSCMCHEGWSAMNSWPVRGMMINDKQESNRELAEKLFLVLNRALNKFSVKIPY